RIAFPCASFASVSVTWLVGSLVGWLGGWLCTTKTLEAFPALRSRPVCESGWSISCGWLGPPEFKRAGWGIVPRRKRRRWSSRRRKKATVGPWPTEWGGPAEPSDQMVSVCIY
ncbi:unnamed protein product, partial [Musa textilis]